jgi:hypothetical protein
MIFRIISEIAECPRHFLNCKLRDRNDFPLQITGFCPFGCFNENVSMLITRLDTFCEGFYEEARKPRTKNSRFPEFLMEFLSVAVWHCKTRVIA